MTIFAPSRELVINRTVVGDLETVRNVITAQENRGLLLAHSALYPTVDGQVAVKIQVRRPRREGPPWKLIAGLSTGYTTAMIGGTLAGTTAVAAWGLLVGAVGLVFATSVWAYRRLRR